LLGAALALVLSLASARVVVPQTAAADCAEWHDCRQQALAAADRGDFETFHDLAWRAVQKGPPRDASLMYLLARAQALSGRPHDALVMLGRLAEMGITSDALTNPDFARTRELPGWPDVAQRIERLTSPPSAAATPVTATKPASAPSLSASAAPARSTVATAPSAAAAPAAAKGDDAAAPFTGLPVTAAARFPVGRFSPAGLAYDSVSRRFLVGERFERKLVVVGDGATHADDLVRSDSAGFAEISAMDVDARRGDLWVASTAAAGGSAALHKLQLVSGRPLKAFPIAADLQPVRFIDLVTTGTSAVLALDGAGNRLFVLRPGENAITTFVPLNAHDVTSVAAGGDDGFAYVAHGEGLLRVDLRARTAAAVALPKSVSLGRVERIRWYRNTLIAAEADADGSRRIIRMNLNPGGRAITRVTPLEALPAPSGETFLTISGDELLYLSADPSATEVVTYRARLR
jgi:hypothetical protein